MQDANHGNIQSNPLGAILLDQAKEETGGDAAAENDRNGS